MSKAKSPVDAEAQATAEKVGANALAVYNPRGQFVREYSVEIHGAKFKDNAEEFAKNIGGTVRKVR